MVEKILALYLLVAFVVALTLGFYVLHTKGPEALHSAKANYHYRFVGLTNTIVTALLCAIILID